MARIKMKTVRELNEQDLRDRLQQARTELAKLKVDSAKGTLRKESGKMKPLKRDVARIMTRLNELKKK
jgi:large subunit ribosomal protein L29